MFYKRIIWKNQKNNWPPQKIGIDTIIPAVPSDLFAFFHPLAIVYLRIRKNLKTLFFTCVWMQLLYQKWT